MANTGETNGFTLTGTLYRVFETDAKQSGDKTYYSRKFVLVTSEEYNGNEYLQHIPCELRGEFKCKLIDSWTPGSGSIPGDAIKIHCNMRGVKYNPKDAPQEEKYFSTLDVWRIEKAPQQYAPLSATDAHSAKMAWDNLSPEQQRQALAGMNNNQPTTGYSGGGVDFGKHTGNNNNFSPSPETIDDLPF